MVAPMAKEFFPIFQTRFDANVFALVKALSPPAFELLFANGIPNLDARQRWQDAMIYGDYFFMGQVGGKGLSRGLGILPDSLCGSFGVKFACKAFEFSARGISGISGDGGIAVDKRLEESSDC